MARTSEFISAFPGRHGWKRRLVGPVGSHQEGFDTWPEVSITELIRECSEASTRQQVLRKELPRKIEGLKAEQDRQVQALVGQESAASDVTMEEPDPTAGSASAGASA